MVIGSQPRLAWFRRPLRLRSSAAGLALPAFAAPSSPTGNCKLQRLASLDLEVSPTNVLVPVVVDGTPARMTHDYVRHGTTSLFAAFDIAGGSVIAQHDRRHRHQEFLRSSS